MIPGGYPRAQAGWTQERPPHNRFSRSSTLVYDAGLASVVLFVQGGAASQRELWVWDGDRFRKLGDGVFAGHEFGADLHGIFACPDPAAGQTRLFGQVSGGILISELSNHAVAEMLSLPAGTAMQTRLIAGFPLAGELLLLADDGSVFAESAGSSTLALVAGPPATPVAGRLCTAAADPGRGIIVAGTDEGGHLYVFHPATGWTAGPATGSEGNSLAWNPVTQRIDVLGAGRPDEKAPQRLRPWDDLGADGPRIRHFTRNAPIAFDEARGMWLLLDRDNDVFTAPSSGNFRPVPTPGAFGDLTADWYLTAAAGGRVWAHHTIWDHRIRRFDGDQWAAPDRCPRDMAIVAATPHGLAILDGDGALHRIEHDGNLLRLTAADECAAGRSYRYGLDRLCWDERACRLMLWRGDDDDLNRGTWVHRQGRWSKLADAAGQPPPGPALLSASPVGVYCLAAGQLWLLDADEWRRVGGDPDWTATFLFGRPRGAGLWSLSPAGVGVWRDERFALVAGLPPMVERAVRDQSHMVYDPVGDHVLVYGGTGTWRLDLDAYQLTGIVLPGARAVAAGSDPALPDLQPSCYVLECSGSSEWHQLDLAWPDTDLLRIQGLIEEQFCAREGSDPARLGLALELVGGDFTWRLWTVQNAVLSQGIDLLPHFRVHFRDGTSLTVTPANREAIWDGEDDAVSVSIDWSAAAGAVSELHEPRLRPGDALELRVPAFPDQLDSGCLGHGKWLRRE